MATMPALPILEASLQLEGTRGYLTYRVTNRADRVLFLFNVLHGESDERGHYQVDPGCYVQIADDSVTLSKKILEPPMGTFLEKNNVPFVSRLPAGQHYSEHISFPLPLRERTPFAQPGSGHGTQARPCFFEVGYFFGQAGTDELIQVFQTNSGQQIGFDPFPISSQSVLRVGPLATLPIAL